MSERSLAAFGAVVVLLSGGAAYVGARVASRDAAPAAVPTSEPAEVDRTTLDAFDRRMGYLEKRIEALEEALRNAADAPRSADLAPAAVAPAPAARADAPKSAAPDPTAPAEPTGRDAVIANAPGIFRKTSRTMLVGAMALFADSTKDAQLHRAMQADADAFTLMSRLGLRDDATKSAVGKVFKERWEDGARDIGPVVRDGLERTDIATVRTRLHELDAATDKKLRALFDDATWKSYEPMSAAARDTADSILDEYEKARQSGK